MNLFISPNVSDYTGSVEEFVVENSLFFQF